MRNHASYFVPLLFLFSGCGDGGGVAVPDASADAASDAGRAVSCADSIDCPYGLECIGGECRHCTEDSDCLDGKLCQYGSCGAVCTHRDDCFVLDSIAWSQDPPPVLFGCRTTVDENYSWSCTHQYYYDSSLAGSSNCDPCLEQLGGCAAGQTCERGACTCASNADCPDSLACRDGVCGGCLVDADCGCDKVCENRECHLACGSDDDCPGGRCDTESRRCVVCLTDDDCDGDERCYSSGCVVPCQVDHACFNGDEACLPNGRCLGCESPLGPEPIAPPTMCEG